jgi:cell division GTPase FtsZ
MEKTAVNGTEARSTSDFMKLPKVTPELLFIGSGSAGVNAMKDMLVEIDPEENPNQKLMVIDSDSSLLAEHFLRTEDPNDAYTTRLFKWFDSGRLMIMPIGAGFGAGGDPVEGAKIFGDAFEDKSDFFTTAHAVVQVSGAGGGTGSGVTPVIAQKLGELGVTNYSIISYPRFEDGGDKLVKAATTRSRLLELGPTTTVYNEMISDEEKKLHLSEIYRKIDQACLYPILRTTRWLVQEVGDVQNRDLADFNSYMRFGNHILPGHYQSPEGLVGMETALLGNPYLDKKIIKKAQRIMFLYKGFVFEDQVKVRDYVFSQVNKEVLEGQFESKPGVKEKGVRPEERSVSFFAVAKDGPDEEKEEGNKTRVFVPASLLILESQSEPLPQPQLPEPIAAVSANGNGHANGKGIARREGDVKIKCHNGKEDECAWVTQELANKFGIIYGRNLTKADKDRVEGILKDIEQYSGVTLHPSGLPWKTLTNGVLHSEPQPQYATQ